MYKPFFFQIFIGDNHADLCEDSNGQDYHFRGKLYWHLGFYIKDHLQTLNNLKATCCGDRMERVTEQVSDSCISMDSSPTCTRC